jgi:tetratricopeptide (TPR) repeat protein
MALNGTAPLVKVVALGGVTAAAFAVGGLLGGATVAIVGRFVGDALAVPGKKLLETLCDKVGHYAIDGSAEPLLDGFRRAHPTLNEVYREAYRLSLLCICPPAVKPSGAQTLSLNLDEAPDSAAQRYDEWFRNWDAALAAGVTFDVEAPLLPEYDGEIDSCFLAAMTRLDVQGARIRAIKESGANNTSILLTLRPLPEELLDLLKAGLPKHFPQIYKSLLVKPENIAAMNEYQLFFQENFLVSFARLEPKVDVVVEITGKIDQKQDALMELVANQGKMIEELLRVQVKEAINDGRISAEEARKIIAERDEYIEKYRFVQQQLAAHTSDPAEVNISVLLDAGDVDGAFRYKSAQVSRRQADAEKLPRDFYELGGICELRLDWPVALENYRQAWQLSRDPEHGFKYAHFAQKLNNFHEAIPAYEALIQILTDPSFRTIALNNLANLYSVTQRMEKAEQTYNEALKIRRHLAQANPDVHLPYVADTLNNLAVLYRNTQRIREAEQVFDEALKINRQLADANPDTYLPGVATTLNNLANLYSDTQRMKEAGQVCDEALNIYRQLAGANPDAYMYEVAATLNNLAALYYATQRMKEAGQANDEALKIYRKLADANPDAYLPDVATTLNTHANLYSETQRLNEAEQAYDEALKIRRKLAAVNSEAYLPDVAETLNNLAILYCNTQRIKEAGQAYKEALKIYRQLAAANPDTYLPYVAGTLNNLGLLYSDTQRMKEAGKAYDEALKIRRKLAEVNPDAYLRYVANTLNNLAVLCFSMEQMPQAETRIAEAESILQPLWQVNPELHGNNLARILSMRVLICEASHKPAAETLAYGRRALAAAYDPTIKQSIHQLIGRFSPTSTH